MYKSFEDIISAACARTVRRTIAIAQAADDKMIHVAQAVTERNLCDVILVGDGAKIARLMDEAGFASEHVSVVDEPDVAIRIKTDAEHPRTGA